MQRSLASMLFSLAAVLLAVAAGGWWLQRVAFTPDTTRGTAAAILSDPDIRREINSVVTTATAPVLGVDASSLGRFLEAEILSTRAGAEMMAQTMYEAHNKIIGDREPLIRLTGTEMIQIVRDDRAADANTVTLPIESIGTLVAFKVGLRWLAPIAAALGALAGLAGLVTRPSRRDLVRGLGELLIALAGGLVLFGYVFPVFLVPAFDNQTWAHAIPGLARRYQLVIAAFAVPSAAIGAVLILSGAGEEKRQTSTPLAASRYRAGGNQGWG